MLVWVFFTVRIVPTLKKKMHVRVVSQVLFEAK